MESKKLSEAEQQYILMEGDLLDLDLEGSDSEDCIDKTPKQDNEVTDEQLEAALQQFESGLQTVSNEEFENMSFQFSNISDTETSVLNEQSVISLDAEPSTSSSSLPSNSNTELPICTAITENVSGKPSRSKKLLWGKTEADTFDSEWKGQLPDSSDEVLTPLQHFKIFIDNDILDNIVQQTNLYSVQKNRVIYQHQ